MLIVNLPCLIVCTVPARPGARTSSPLRLTPRESRTRMGAFASFDCASQPNASLPMHDRPARVVIPLTPNDVRISRADGTTSTTRTAADRVAWSEPTRRSVTNLADSTLENIIVELKMATASANAAQPPVPAPLEYLADSRHRWLFENEYLRVYDVRIPPGETTDFHRHAYDTVTVRVSGGLIAIQPQGGPWGKTERIEPGVAFSADSKNPVVHRVRNDGTTDYRVVLVQLLR